MTVVNSSYSVMERVFRTAVFQNGVAHQFLETSLISFIESCRHLTCHPQALDPQRAEKGLALWKRLGAKELTVIPKDGKAEIHGVYWSARDLEHEIEARGGRWKKIEIEEKEQREQVLAIIPPEKLNEAWRIFEKDLQKFWPRQSIHTPDGTLEVLITCREAEEISTKESHQRLFLHSNSASVSYIMLRRRAAFYIGMQQNLCFYDPRGTWKSKGVASEGGYYNDILAVYEEVCKQHAPEQIWVTGACLGCNAAAFLKITTRSPCNLILENAFADLQRDFIDYENVIARVFARRFKAGISARDLSTFKPQETGFSIEATSQAMPSDPLPGKVVIIRVVNDQRIPPVAANRMLKVAKRISNDVYPISFQSKEEDPHFDRYFRHSSARRALISTFSPSSQAPAIKEEPSAPPQKSWPYLKIMAVIALIIGLVSVFFLIKGSPSRRLENNH